MRERAELLLKHKDASVRELAAGYLELLDSKDKDIGSKFYNAFCKAMEKVIKEMENGTLDLEDSYTKAVLAFAEKNEKIFIGLEKGKEAYFKEDQASGNAKRIAGKVSEEAVAV